MKYPLLIAAALFLFLPNLPLQTVPADEQPVKAVTFVVDANRYAWAWAQESYYTCFLFTQDDTPT